jgi:hypothetical protein
MRAVKDESGWPSHLITMLEYGIAWYRTVCCCNAQLMRRIYVRVACGGTRVFIRMTSHLVEDERVNRDKKYVHFFLDSLCYSKGRTGHEMTGESL